MKADRLFILTAACAALAAPFAAHAAPFDGASAAACPAVALTPLERRITEQAARGLPSLVSFVNLSKPIYQLDFFETVAWLDSERGKQAACVVASARTATLR